jgi:hypothetical protein
VYVKPTAPRSIGGIVDDAIRLYRDAFAKSWPLTLCAQLLIAVPVLIIRFQVTAVPVVAGDPLAALAIFKSPGVWLSYFVAAVLTVGFYNALVVLLDGIATTKVESVGQSLAAGFRLLPRTVLLYVVMLVALMVAGVCVGVLAGILGKAASPIVSGVFVVAFAAIVIYVWGRAFLANIALVVEDARVFESLKISWALIENHWWRTATVYTIALAIAMVFYFLIGFLSGVVVAILHSSIGMVTVVSQLISIVGGTLLMSFFPAVLLAMYHDLKLRKEGADLASRVNALAPR